ncbi:hypothetical protein [Luteolibacter sp. Populi]|uniref:hypothetical protein n=1 Tax=Luteolibacter sp. Populi TaxID=3230487 RepID=UPI003466F30B
MLIFAGSFAVWAHFARKGQAAKQVILDAKAQEELDKRYPVKGRRSKERVAPLPPPVDGPGLNPDALPERPRIRIRRAEE